MSHLVERDPERDERLGRNLSALANEPGEHVLGADVGAPGAGRLLARDDDGHAGRTDDDEPIAGDGLLLRGRLRRGDPSGVLAMRRLARHTERLGDLPP